MDGVASAMSKTVFPEPGNAYPDASPLKIASFVGVANTPVGTTAVQFSIVVPMQKIRYVSIMRLKKQRILKGFQVLSLSTKMAMQPVQRLLKR